MEKVADFQVDKAHWR